MRATCLIILCGWHSLACATGLLSHQPIPHRPRRRPTPTALPSSAGDEWQTVADIVAIRTPWVTLLGERLEDSEGNQTLDYWRVEKADSAVVLTLRGDQILLPKMMYRPGVGRTTLDFPGGRVPEGTAPVDVVPSILQRELGVAADDIAGIEALNDDEGWPINSSFSNQLLYGFVATLHDEANLDEERLHPRSYTLGDVDSLFDELHCLQCRSVLLEFLRKRQLFDDTSANHVG